MQVREQGKHEEKRAQHIFAFRDPRDRLHMQRMHSENRRDKRASPQGACHALQRHKKKDDGERVQEDIGKVVPARV